MKFKLFYLTLLLICSAGHAALGQNKFNVEVVVLTQATQEHEIAYKNGHSLTIADFEGTPDAHSDAVAMAYTGVMLNYEGNMKGNIVNLKIFISAIFDKNKSWFLDRAKDEWTLAHEQRHFDITAKNACALADAIKRFQFTKDFQKEITDLHQKYKTLNEAEQDRYDAECNHGINKEQQLQWNKRITEEIKSCSTYY